MLCATCMQAPFGEHVAVHTFGFGEGHSAKLLQVRDGGGHVVVVVVGGGGEEGALCQTESCTHMKVEETWGVISIT